jgi:fructose-bisphosphate aldolase class II
MKELEALCRDRFGTAGHASKIKVIAMDDMAKRCASGSLGATAPASKAA